MKRVLTGTLPTMINPNRRWLHVFTSATCMIRGMAAETLIHWLRRCPCPERKRLIAETDHTIEEIMEELCGDAGWTAAWAVPLTQPLISPKPEPWVVPIWITIKELPIPNRTLEHLLERRRVRRVPRGFEIKAGVKGRQINRRCALCAKRAHGVVQGCAATRTGRETKKGLGPTGKHTGITME